MKIANPRSSILFAISLLFLSLVYASASAHHNIPEKKVLSADATRDDDPSPRLDLDNQQKIYLEKIYELEEKIVLLESRSGEFGFTEWAGILLACVSVILTVLGVVIAILSFFGYKAAVNKAEDIASSKTEETVSKIARELISEKIDDGDFNDLIQEAVDKVTYRGIFSASAEED